MVKKKVRKKEAANQAAKPVQPAQPAPVKVQRPESKDIMSEKDRQILSEVDRVIWNPSLLNKFKPSGTQAPDGHDKKKR